MPKSRGRTPSVSSSQRSGVETGAPGRGRTEYTDAIVLPRAFWRWSTSTAPSGRFRFSHSVVARPSLRASTPRDTSSANSYVSSNVERRVIGTSRWIEVEDDVVRTRRLVDARVPGVHVDAVLLHHPEERVARVDECEVDEPRAALARTRRELPRRDPLRDASRRLLLEVGLLGYPMRVALHRERPTLQVRHDRVGDLAVVLEQVPLRDPVLGEEHAVGAREGDLRHCRKIGPRCRRY